MTEHGTYIAVDLDENNRHTREQWAERHGREPRSFGWGVCRQGYGLQDHGQDRGAVLTEAQAVAWAAELNASG